MKIMRNKSKVAIALFLALSFAVSMLAVLPTAGQITKLPDRETGTFLSVNPPLIGARQPLTINLWVFPSPNGPQYEMGTPMNYLGTGGMHYWNITIPLTRPDGSKDIFMPKMQTAFFTRYVGGLPYEIAFVPGETDEVGGIWFLYYPTEIGNWTAQVSFPGN